MSKSKPVSSLLTFRVGPFRFCVDAVEAKAILEAPRINSVPMAPKSIAGVFSYRGRVVVVVSLHRKFGLPDPEQRLSGQIILARINNELKGFWVNEVLDVLENTELKWQAFPSLGSFRICSHTIIKDDTIFFHTDFKSLFAAPDSEEFGSLLASLAGSFQNSGSAEHISKQKTPSKPEAPTAEIKDRIDTQRPSQPGEAIEPAINSRENEKKESASNLSSFTQPEPAATTAAGEKKPIGTPNHPKRKSKPPGKIPTGVDSGTGINWSSGNLRRPGTAGGPKSRRHAATAQRIAPRRIPQPTRRDKYMRPEKSDFGWQKLAAGLLFLMVTAAVSAWFWPQSSSSTDRHSIAEISVKEASPVQVLKSANQPVTADNNRLKPTSGPSANRPESNENIHPPAPTVAVTENPVDRQADFASRTMETVDDKSLSEEGQPPKSSPALTTVGATDRQAESASRKIETVDDESLSEENQVTQSSPAATRAVKEVLRIDTKDFILTIERPKPASKNESVQETLAKWTTDEVIHIVVRGDTLWDIADHYLGDPFRYPELAALSHIKDPHWIYPGDVIRIIRKNPAGIAVSKN